MHPGGRRPLTRRSEQARCAKTRVAGLALLLVAAGSTAGAEPATTPAAWAAVAQNRIRVAPNVPYLRAGGVELQLDVYQAASDGPAPTVVYIHGGGWVLGSRESNVLRLLPYLERGFSAVNVQYRLAGTSLAPAAVEDCLCALRWVARNAGEYGFDVERIVVTGNSAGGHLSLTTGMIPASAGLTSPCPGTDPAPKVAAIVNWYGITDVGDLLGGANEKRYAVQWLGGQHDALRIAQRVSPLSYVAADTPPIVSIHGDADPVVPYAHATRLHQALEAAGRPHRLITVPQGGHGSFPEERMKKVYEDIFTFLAEHVPLTHR